MLQQDPNGNTEEVQFTLEGEGYLAEAADDMIELLGRTTRVRPGEGTALAITLLNKDDDTPAGVWEVNTPNHVVPLFQDVPENRKVTLPMQKIDIPENFH
uniref:Uncharacterized protein n=1 Tax=uncultured bacterium esnapd12 TaxID=1366592 RepID=S5TMM2_9BACT|nr:hypothetical protein [uncultured bacterium esnapd12]